MIGLDGEGPAGVDLLKAGLGIEKSADFAAVSAAEIGVGLVEKFLVFGLGDGAAEAVMAGGDGRKAFEQIDESAVLGAVELKSEQAGLGFNEAHCGYSRSMVAWRWNCWS